MKNLKEIVILMLIMAAFLLPVVPSIAKLDASNDELTYGIYAVNVLKGKNFDIGDMPGPKLPCLNMHACCNTYHFALSAFILIPFFALFGISIYTLKLAFILLSCSGLIALYYVLKRLFDPGLAFIATLLLSASSSFVYYSSFALHTDEQVIFVLMIFAALFFVNYTRNKKFIYLFWSALALGACLSIKLSAVSYYLGLALASFIVYGREISEKYKKLTAAQVFLLASGFCLGAVLFIYYNALTAGNTFKLINYLFSNHNTCLGVNNMDFIRNIGLRSGQLYRLLRDEPGTDSFVAGGAIQFILFCAGFVFNGYVIYRKINNYANIVVFLYIFFLTVFLSSLFSPGSMRYDHLALMQPLQQFVLAMFVCNIYVINDRVGVCERIKKISKISAVLILLVILAVKINGVLAYESKINEQAKHLGSIDGCVQRLVDYAKSNNLSPLVMPDNGLYFKVIMHASENFEQLYCLVYYSKEQSLKKAEALALGNKQMYFIFEEEGIFHLGWPLFSNERLQWIKEFAASKKMDFKTFGTVKSFDGTVIYTVYQLSARTQVHGG